jgi:uncharacterized protein (DUF1015 family)
MSEVKAFKGVLYDIDKIGGDYSLVTAPPYDVISPAEQADLYLKNEYNIIKLILGESFSEDASGDNKYIRAGKLLKEWTDGGITKKDDNENFYVYVQEYEVDGVKYRRQGFIGLMKIEESGEQDVLPHEHTLAKPKEDRMNLIKQVRCNLSPIFSLFLDETGEVDGILDATVSGSDPLVDIEIDGVRHMLWRLSDRDEQARISKNFSDKQVFIADGHHRYAVAKSYRDMMRKEPGYNGDADHILMYFADMRSDDNLTVMATHRVLKNMPVSDDAGISAKLEGYFNVTELDSLESLKKNLADATEKHVFGFYGGNKYLLLELKDEVVVEEFVSGEKSLGWKKLDVSILHSSILDNLLGIDEEEGNIIYVHTAEEANELVLDGKANGAFFLNPTKVTQLKAVAESGDMMPQKSTYFYPKLLTGLVINKFEG